MIFDVLKLYIQTQHCTVPMLYLHGRYMLLTKISILSITSCFLLYHSTSLFTPLSLTTLLLPSITQSFTSAQYIPHNTYQGHSSLPPSYSVMIHPLNPIHQMFHLFTFFLFILFIFLSFYSFIFLLLYFFLFIEMLTTSALLRDTFKSSLKFVM